MGNYSQLKVKLEFSIQKGQRLVKRQIGFRHPSLFGCENDIEPAEGCKQFLILLTAGTVYSSEAQHRE